MGLKRNLAVLCHGKNEDLLSRYQEAAGTLSCEFHTQERIGIGNSAHSFVELVLRPLYYSFVELVLRPLYHRYKSCGILFHISFWPR